MSDHAQDEGAVPPDVRGLVTDDDTPVDSLFQEKQMRLFVEPLYSSWKPTTSDGKPRTFLAAAHVGIFSTVRERAVVPDMLLSMDVSVPDEFWRKDRRSYYMWEFGKLPEIVIEIVSNREGGELESKRAIYSKLRIAHYVVFDHAGLYGETKIHSFEMRGDLLVDATAPAFERLGLKLVPWSGTFEGKQADWLRWATLDGPLIPTGQERAESEHQRAESEHQRAESEHQRAEALAAKLRALGIDPDER